MVTNECEENLKSGVQPTPETSCTLSTVSTMVNVERKKSNMRKCNRTTGSINRPAFSAPSTAMQARNQFRTIWWSAESTHFPGLVLRIYVKTMPRELQSHWSFYSIAKVASYVPVWGSRVMADFITDQDTFQRTTMLASNSLLTITYPSPLTPRNAGVETVPFSTTTINA